MSTFSVPVVKYTLEKHPGADNLQIANIKGWQAIVRTEDFETTDPMYKDLNLGVYVPLDAITDKDHPLLSFLEGKKVKARRLRGIFSQGVLLPLEKVVSTYRSDLKKFPEEGDNLSTILGIKKWEPELVSTSLSVKGPIGYNYIDRPSWLSKYTDIENYNNYPNIIQPGESVQATLKLHGSSAVFGRIQGTYYICSMGKCLRNKEVTIRVPRFKFRSLNNLLERFNLDQLKVFSKPKVLPVPDSTWHKVFTQFELEDKLNYLLDLVECGEEDDDLLPNGSIYGEIVGDDLLPNVAIYGEIVGVQDGGWYGLKPGELDFYVYDIRVQGSKNKRGTNPTDYVDPKTLTALCEDLKLKQVPILFEGPFTPEVLDLQEGPDPIGKNHVREGIIIKPLIPRCEYTGRVVLKKIGQGYLLRKNATDD